MLKQNKFISTVTIIGTALAITMVMVIVVTRSVNTANISPESNRYRTMYIKYYYQNKIENNGSISGPLEYGKCKDYLLRLKTPEMVSLQKSDYQRDGLVKAEGKKDYITSNVIETDANFWKIMSFSFIEGKPFNETEFNSGIPLAVISQSTAAKLFGKEEALGRTIDINFRTYKVAAVVKDVSRIFRFAWAEIWIPYTSVPGYEKRGYNALLLAKSTDDFDAIGEEVRGCEKKINTLDKEWVFHFNGPHDHVTQLANIYSNQEPDTVGAKRKMIIILGVLLIVPAINLSSFSMSRIKRRTEEIGVRKAFGAKKYIILTQVLYENFITSLIGGLIGLLLSFGVVYYFKVWLLDISPDAHIPLQALVSLPVFIGVFVASFLLNLISAGIPAYRASKMSIVDSLKQNN